VLKVRQSGRGGRRKLDDSAGTQNRRSIRRRKLTGRVEGEAGRPVARRKSSAQAGQQIWTLSRRCKLAAERKVRPEGWMRDASLAFGRTAEREGQLAVQAADWAEREAERFGRRRKLTVIREAEPDEGVAAESTAGCRRMVTKASLRRKPRAGHAN